MKLKLHVGDSPYPSQWLWALLPICAGLIWRAQYSLFAILVKPFQNFSKDVNLWPGNKRYEQMDGRRQNKDGKTMFLRFQRETIINSDIMLFFVPLYNIIKSWCWFTIFPAFFLWFWIQLGLFTTYTAGFMATCSSVVCASPDLFLPL